jgi:hypothetical protein
MALVGQVLLINKIKEAPKKEPLLLKMEFFSNGLGGSECQLHGLPLQ